MDDLDDLDDVVISLPMIKHVIKAGQKKKHCVNLWAFDHTMSYPPTICQVRNLASNC